MKNRVLRTLALAVALTSVAAAAAPAAVVEKGRFVDDPYGFSYDCGFPVEVTGVASGHFRLREGTGDDATAFFSLDRISFREIHTNPQTGAWFSLSGHFANNEVGATRVEGSLFTFKIIKAGQVAMIEDSEGNLVSRDRGVLRQHDPVRHGRRPGTGRRVRRPRRPSPRRTARRPSTISATSPLS